ncbi:hypothetical protein ECANGB1_1020 [Enterospora canceri]|uniref:Bacterial surface antigen (D15) domain-containing protein n=1 Tax=Enterospora canceri TaxID=1081671 RepID=A0A1Y1S6Y8_9MICR|nr:hypothetical protein ECANGB1_1020 [Enterospora canceri]
MFGRFSPFTGHKKTDTSFLEDIRSISGSKDELLSNLRRVGLFNSVSMSGNRIHLDEKPNEFKLSYSSSGKRRVLLNGPNLFRCGERVFIQAEIRQKESKHESRDVSSLCLLEKMKYLVECIQSKVDLSSLTAEVSRPFTVGGSLGFIRGNLSSKSVELGESRIRVRSVEGGVERGMGSWFVGCEWVNDVMYKLTRINMKICDFNLNTKIGHSRGKKEKEDDMSTLNSSEISKSSLKETLKKGYSEFVAEIKQKYLGDFYVNLGLSRRMRHQVGWLFGETQLEMGRILGRCSVLEKYFVNVRGFKKKAIGPVDQNKKLGGTSFMSAQSNLGLCYKNLSIFGFYDVAVNTRKGIQHNFKMLENSESSCVGKSVGIGLRIKNGISVTYARPLTKSLETERFQVEFDMKF